MDPDTFKGKVWLSVIDKVIIGFFAAIILAGLQYWSHKYQEILDASISVSKIYSGILLKQREDIIGLMENYFLLLETIKDEGKAPTKDQEKLLNGIRYKIMFIKETLNTATPQDKPDKPLTAQLKKAKEKVDANATALLQATSEMNMYLHEIIKREKKVLFEKFDPKFAKVKQKYQDLLESLRDVSVKTVRLEIKETH